MSEIRRYQLTYDGEQTVTSYKINGVVSTEQQALLHWITSESYDSARVNTRGTIWPLSHQKNGGPEGEINWLNEAGIEIVASCLEVI